MKTLKNILQEYLDHLAILNYSPLTIKNIRCNCLFFTTWLSETYSVTECNRIRRLHITAWIKHINSKTTGEGLPLKAVSINKLIQNIRGFMKYLVKEGFILGNLPETLEYVKTPTCLPVNILNNATVRKMLGRIDTTTDLGCRDRAILELMYTAGLRACEVASLDIGNIDLESRTALVTGKGNKERVVPIGKTAIRHLTTWIMGVRPFMITDRTEKALFVTRLSLRVKYSCLLKIIRKYAKHAKIPHRVATHCLRRACTTELVKSGANLYHIKELLGHEGFETLKRYTKLTITDLKKTHAKHHPREKDS